MNTSTTMNDDDVWSGKCLTALTTSLHAASSPRSAPRTEPSSVYRGFTRSGIVESGDVGTYGAAGFIGTFSAVTLKQSSASYLC